MVEQLANERRRGRVLYVDDERANLTVFEAAYEDDYEVYVAASAKEAIAALREHVVDVVITDQRMPQMTGVQFLEAIQGEYPHAIRMILTGFSDIEAIIQAINTGRVDLYLTKPYDVAALKVTIDRALELRDIESRNRGLVGALERAIEREKRVRAEFQSYVPEAVVRAVLHGDGIARAMKGEARIVTVVFARILGFRRLAASLGSEKVFGLLGSYYDAMNRAIRRHKGFLTEMIADEVLAVFGAPVSSLANEANAVLAAQEMVQTVRAFEAQHAALLGGSPSASGSASTAARSSPATSARSCA